MGTIWSVATDDREQFWYTISLIFLQATSAAMLGGALAALGALAIAVMRIAAPFYIFPTTSTQTPAGLTYDCFAGDIAYEATLSFTICLVAFAHYHAMRKRRERTLEAYNLPGVTECQLMAVKKQDSFIVGMLRYSDWLVTMPLLALKVLSMARQGSAHVAYDPNDFWNTMYAWDYMPGVVAALAFGMILFGLVAKLGVGDFEDCEGWRDPLWVHAIRLVCFALGGACLVLLFILFVVTCDRFDSFRRSQVIGFSAVWFLYPVCFVLSGSFGDWLCKGFLMLCGPRKDVAYAILDCVSKALLAFSVLLRTHKLLMFLGWIGDFQTQLTGQASQSQTIALDSLANDFCRAY